MDLEEVWRIREDEVYPELFGSAGRGIFTLSPAFFRKQFAELDIDPRWTHLGVIEYPPTKARDFWLYATSGYSNPWDEEPETYDPAGESGSGVEFTFAVSEQGDWAIETLLFLLAYDLLLRAGRFLDRQPLALYNRIAFRAPINGDPACEIRNVVMVEPEQIPPEFSLPSGRVLFVGFTGVTDSELAFAKAHRSVDLINRLRAAGHHPVTDPRRRSLI